MLSSLFREVMCSFERDDGFGIGTVLIGGGLGVDIFGSMREKSDAIAGCGMGADSIGDIAGDPEDK